MTRRDRLVVSTLAALALVALMWIGVVSPKRHDAARLQIQLTTQQTRLASAQSQVQQGLTAEAGYKQNLTTVAQLFRAVPSTDGVPRLLVALTRTSTRKRVDFRLVQVSGAGASGGAPAAASPFQNMGFTFQFNGGYIDLQRFIHAVDRYAVVRNGLVVARGRLLTIQGVSLTPGVGGHRATASVTAVAYVEQPASVASPVSPVSPGVTPAAGAATPSTATQPVATPSVATPSATNVRNTP